MCSARTLSIEVTSQHQHTKGPKISFVFQYVMKCAILPGFHQPITVRADTLIGKITSVILSENIAQKPLATGYLQECSGVKKQACHQGPVLVLPLHALHVGAL